MPVRQLDDARWMRAAVALAHRCPPSVTAFAVGAVIVAADGEVLATGYSRELDPLAHAEESALAKLDPDDPRLAAATIYSTLEPCAHRASRDRSCAELILDAGIGRVVTAWREPPLFVVDARGMRTLSAAGIEVVELDEFAAAAMDPNRHLAIG